VWRLGRTDTFVRTARRFLRRRQPLQPHVREVLRILEQDPFDPRLKTHPLHGKLEGLHACRVTRSVRLVLRIESEERTVTLLDLGEHDQVYR
jgi:addiction module RelE/StbE family toxin